MKSKLSSVTDMHAFLCLQHSVTLVCLALAATVACVAAGGGGGECPVACNDLCTSL